MIEVEEMRQNEIDTLLSEVRYGHLGFSVDDQPYVVPVHYVFDGKTIYVYTTEGKKTEIVRRNPRVCLQVENVVDDRNWKSVVVSGRAEIVEDVDERNKALEEIGKVNPTLTPAVSIRWMDSWIRENVEAILRIDPEIATGRASVDRSETGTPLVPGQETHPTY
ncbi:MAG TPA: pyridoxamine 5'-phosphate oxidase family protein [Pyrinomonadaceae bacterium]|nr:pyridoxamine 5'-phosphate oxidase family protein [Pyrinomonadaceae bacterium]HMP64660.1 pyridoxamine 5'-phosphate oxidase family protein [Pyrinomonadaceae bacterium]